MKVFLIFWIIVTSIQADWICLKNSSGRDLRFIETILSQDGKIGFDLAFLGDIVNGETICFSLPKTGLMRLASLDCFTDDQLRTFAVQPAGFEQVTYVEIGGLVNCLELTEDFSIVVSPSGKVPDDSVLYVEPIFDLGIASLSTDELVVEGLADKKSAKHRFRLLKENFPDFNVPFSLVPDTKAMKCYTVGLKNGWFSSVIENTNEISLTMYTLKLFASKQTDPTLSDIRADELWEWVWRGFEEGHKAGGEFLQKQK